MATKSSGGQFQPDPGKITEAYKERLESPATTKELLKKSVRTGVWKHECPRKPWFAIHPSIRRRRNLG
jgi:hypothetical protein